MKKRLNSIQIYKKIFFALTLIFFSGLLHAQPQSEGQSLLKDTVLIPDMNNSKYGTYFDKQLTNGGNPVKIGEVIIPSMVFVTAGATTFKNRMEIQNKVLNWGNGFSTRADDYLQLAPLAFPFIAGVAGGNTRNNFWTQSLLLVTSEILTMSMVYSLKYSLGVQRPSGGAYNSTPSGHTAQAFVSATFMHHELKHISIWYSVAAYSMAATTGLFRVLNNRHWVPDVLFGAAIGLISTNLVYYAYDKIYTKKIAVPKSETAKISFLPYGMMDGGGVSMVLSFLTNVQAM